MNAVTFREAVRVWVRVGLQSFGGPAGQIAVMHRILVEEKGWVRERQFLHALNYCMLLPGPEAQQLATYIGWLLHGYRGGLVAGLLFVLPGFIAILVLSWIYAAYGGTGVVTALFFGLKAAVLAIVIDAVIRIGRRVLRNGLMVSIAASAFAGIFLFELPFPVIVISAGVVGLIGGVWRPERFVVIGGPASDENERSGPEPENVDALGRVQRSAGRAFRVLLAGSIVWLGPVLVLFLVLGPTSIYVTEALFFSKAAVVTFGGAYAVLAYIAQQAVERYGWLQAGEMLDGLGMAETTPGPLIMVVQFVGFMGAFRHPGPLDPFLAGTLGAVVTTWVTFAPCFLWIFLGAPYVESLRGNRKLSAALSAITAAVVGVILNLGIWFGLHVIFAELSELRGPLGLRLLIPDWGTIDVYAALLSLAALVAILRFRTGIVPVLVISALAGIVLHFI